MPVEEAVKVIGGLQAGSAPVSTASTAGKALDAVPVGPDPAAAGNAADDAPQDGDYFLDANLADSMLVGLQLSCTVSILLFTCISVHMKAFCLQWFLHICVCLTRRDATKMKRTWPPARQNVCNAEDQQHWQHWQCKGLTPIDLPCQKHVRASTLYMHNNGTGQGGC